MKLNKKYLLATSAFANPDLLKTCIDSWPKFIDQCIFFDGKNSDEIFSDILNHEDYSNVYKINPSEHLGASGGWNRILNYAFNKNDYDVVIIVGSDTEMKEGFLEAFLKDHEEKNPDFSCGRDTGFNCFAVNRKCYRNVGTFDENFFPAYYEDNDYDRRVRLSHETIIYDICGETGLLEHYGSATIRKDNDFNSANGVTFSINKEYYIRKWGAAPPDPDVYETPFNNSNYKIKDWFLEHETFEKKKEIWRKK